MPVALYNETNNFKGLAVFENFHEAVQYKKIFEEKLMKVYLRERGKGHESSNDNRSTFNRGEVRIFVEREMPNIKTYF